MNVYQWNALYNPKHKNIKKCLIRHNVVVRFIHFFDIKSKKLKQTFNLKKNFLIIKIKLSKMQVLF